MNYSGTGRTNYFRVTDEEKYNILAKGLSGENVEFFEEPNNPTIHGFACDNGINYYRSISQIGLDEFLEVDEDTGAYKPVFDEDHNEIDIKDIDKYDKIYNEDGDEIFDRFEDDDSFDTFVSELQKILPDDEVFVYMESGAEGYRYVTGYALVASNKRVEYVSLSDFINKTVEAFLGKGKTTKYEY